MASIRAALPFLLPLASLALAQNSTTSSSSNSTSSGNSTFTSTSGTSSSKRGLVYVNPSSPSDNNFWDSSSSDMTWYYNYADTPTPAFADSDLEFIPMLWGAPSNPTTDMTFYNQVQALIAGGTNITHVLGFNEPDGCSDGGSCVSATVAAQVWKKQFEPMKAKFNVQLGAPAVTGANTGFTWLQNWQTACAAIDGKGCEVDFIPIHWYGNFAGLASHVGQVNASYSNNVSSIWCTEFAYANEDLEDTQYFYNQSTDYFDRLS